MTRLLTLLWLLTILADVRAASLADAFTEGAQFGRSGNTAARSRIDTGTASATVPGYTSSAPATSYFGSPGLGAGATATINDCTMPGQMENPACQAVNFSQTNPGQRPSFVIAPNNPLLTKARSITADPAAIAGNIAGTYSACTTQTVTAPDIFETRVCNEYRTLDRQTCDKTLNVSVVDNGLNCSYGSYITPNPRIMLIRPFVFVGAICADDIRFMWIYGFSECNGTNDSIYVPTIVPTEEPIRMIVNLGCGGRYYLTGSCPDGNCSYTVGQPDVQTECVIYCGDECCGYQTEDYPLAGFAFQRPTRTYTITDSWNNQCATYEARLP